MTLCAYIRENSYWRPPAEHGLPEWEPLADDASEQDRAAHLVRRRERFGGFYVASQAWGWAQGLGAPQPGQRASHHRDAPETTHALLRPGDTRP